MTFSRHTILSLVLLMIVNLFGICSAESATKVNVDQLDVRIAEDYGLSVNDLVPLKQAGMSLGQIRAYLESLYPIEANKVDTANIVALANETNMSAHNAIQAFSLARQYRRDPYWLASLYQSSQSWDKVKKALKDHQDARECLVGSSVDSKAKDNCLSLISNRFEVSLEGITSLTTQGIDPQTLVDLLFMTAATSLEESPFANFRGSVVLESNWQAYMPDLEQIHQVWPRRRFPRQYLPLTPPMER